MTRPSVPGEKPLYWVASSLKDIARFPSDVRRSVGFALSAAQYGGRHQAAKPWKGDGPGVLEVVKDYDGDTYRAIYTFASRRPSTFCTSFRRNRRAESRPGNPMSPWSANV
jgi:phage-related protein